MLDSRAVEHVFVMHKKDSSSDRLEALEQRIKKAKHKPEVEPSGASIALRMGSEMVAGVMVGAGFGYLVDGFFGTIPLFLIIFLFIGSAAGVKMMMQTSARYSDQMETEEKESEK